VAMHFERFLPGDRTLLRKRASEVKGSGTPMLSQPIMWACGDPNVEILTFGNDVDPPSV